MKPYILGCLRPVCVYLFVQGPSTFTMNERRTKYCSAKVPYLFQFMNIHKASTYVGDDMICDICSYKETLSL